ncbi:hypothetical protein B0E52_13820 [Rhodanobacter sp. C06]|uniref:hypothetical protein n=1 Tax=Rhodanobacter sp. C06 TaxID=1945854 RepID=UPI000986DF90|nr:hypothetical protein [Rhodanobacter sp. C06]OOG38752.1 hypothetical protein B0E52_13820 [Rhodanobacter sp. C06]
MRGWHCLALAGALSLLTAAAAAAAQQAAPAPAAGDSAREQALQAFQHDLVSVLALRATAEPLLGAALLARPLPRQPKTNSFHALINRAAAAGDAGPAVQWVRLADCDAKADACPSASALRKLVEQAPDNAAVWLLKFGLDTRDMKSDAARADLAKAAAAKLYDDYTGSSLAALAGVVDALPPPPATQGAGGPVGVQALIVQGNARLQPRPALPIVAKLCENAGDDAAIKLDCLKLGKLLEWGSSPLARSLGLHLREVLGDATAQAEARQQRRDLIWQVQNYSQLALRAQDDPALAQQLLAASKRGGTEMSQLIAVLRASGVSTTAPGSWQPPAPDAPAPAHSP